MRVLIKRSSNPSVQHIFDGLGRVLVQIGYNPVLWDSAVKPSFDAFDEIRPDIAFISDYDLTATDIRALAEYPQCLFVLHQKYPQDENYWDFASFGVKPDVEFMSVRPELAKGKLSLPCAVDILDRRKVNPAALFAISSICDRQKFEQYLRPLCDVRSPVNLSIFSEDELGVNQYFGSAEGNESTVYKQSYLSVIFGHNKYESNHKLYECIKYGGLPLVEYNETDQSILSSTFPSFMTREDMENWFKHYKSYPKNKEKTMGMLTKICSEKHTYHHRAINLFGALGLQEIVSKIEGTAQ